MLFFMPFHVTLTAIDSERTLHLVLVLVGIHLAAASRWVLTKFYMSFGVSLLDVSLRISTLFLTVTVY